MHLICRHRARIGQLHVARIVAPQLVFRSFKCRFLLRQLASDLRFLPCRTGLTLRHRQQPQAQSGDALLCFFTPFFQCRKRRRAREARHICLTQHFREHARLAARGDRQRFTVKALPGRLRIENGEDANQLAIHIGELAEKRLTRFFRQTLALRIQGLERIDCLTVIRQRIAQAAAPRHAIGHAAGVDQNVARHLGLTRIDHRFGIGLFGLRTLALAVVGDREGREHACGIKVRRTEAFFCHRQRAQVHRFSFGEASTPGQEYG